MPIREGERLFSTSDHLVGGSIILFSLIVFVASPVRQIGDSKYSMLLSDSLLKWQSFTLDHYKIPILPPTILREDYVQDGDIYQLEVVNNHVYFFFPPGTSILSTPFVALARLFRISPVNPDGTYNLEGETKIQIGLATLLMAVLAGLFFYTARLALSTSYSILVAFAGAFGTQVWSTASRAMYADTWALVLLGVTVFLLLGQESGRFDIKGIVLATLLSWIYFVSPLYSTHIAAITIYMFILHRNRFFSYAVTGSVWLAGFVIYSWYNFKSLLPHYFMASRLSIAPFWTALPGHLVSPSRGLFIFVPVVAFVLYLLFCYRRYIAPRRLAVLALLIMAAHTIVISCFPVWWGGHGYGPRFTTGLAPWIVLLGIFGLRAMIEWRRKHETLSAIGYRAQNIFGAVLLAFSVFANARGAISSACLVWNSRPSNIDMHPERLWDWRQPQFLAGLLHPPLPEVFPMLQAGDRIDFNQRSSDVFMWYGWSDPEQDFRWSEAREAVVIFSTSVSANSRLKFRMGAFLVPGRLDEQKVLLDMNGVPLEPLSIKEGESADYVVNVPAAALRPRNFLTFRLPAARTPASFGLSNDARRLGIRVEWMEFSADTRLTSLR